MSSIFSPLLWGFVCNFRQFQQEADASVKTDENRLCPNGSRFTRKIVPRNCRSGNGNAVIDKKSRQITTRGFKPNCINFIRFIKKSRQTRSRKICLVNLQFQNNTAKKIFEHYSLDGKKTYATLTDFFHCCSKDTNSFCLHIVSIEIKRLERRDTTEYEICERYCMFSTVQ